MDSQNGRTPDMQVMVTERNGVDIDAMGWKKCGMRGSVAQSSNKAGLSRGRVAEDDQLGVVQEGNIGNVQVLRLRDDGRGRMARRGLSKQVWIKKNMLDGRWIEMAK